MTDNAFPVPGVSTASTAAQWEDLFASPLLLGGVVPGVGSNLPGSLDTGGRNAVVGTGGALIRGYYKPVSSATSTAIPAASAQDRIDRLTLRLDRSQTNAANWIVPHIIVGAASASPVEPPLVQTITGLWDLPICSWTSKANGSLTNLSDERYYLTQTLTGLSTSRPTPATSALLIEQDTGNLMAFNAGAWTTLVLQSDTVHTITNFAASGWSGTLAYTQITLGLVTISATLTLGSNAAVADGTVICSLSSKYAPQTFKQIPMRCDALKVSPQSGSDSYESAALSIRADGTVAVYGVSTAASLLDGSGSYALGF